MQKTLAFKLDKEGGEKLFQFLQQHGQKLENNNQYVDWYLKGAYFTAVMYKSGKFVLQTRDDELAKKVSEEFMTKEQQSNVEEKFFPHIGSDEVGKGDYFGPLVVCACYVSEGDLELIQNLGVMDSKKINDERVLEIGEVLISKLFYKVKVVKPKEYNKLILKYQNASIVLAKAHGEVLSDLYNDLEDKSERVEFAVVDQFSKSKKRLSDEFKLNIPLKQFHKGESDIAVACASVIARFFFLLEFQLMREEYGLDFPLGATHVIPFGKKFVDEYGFDELVNVAKVSFRTTQSLKK